MANSEAIAWYVEESRRLLEVQQLRAESLQTRAGQIAGFGALLLALIGGNAATILHEAQGGSKAVIAALLVCSAFFLAVSVAVAVIGVGRSQSYASVAADEIDRYLSDPFLNAPELWRVHVRSLRTLKRATEDAQERAHDALKSITVSLYAFLAGLAFAVSAVVILTVELI
jgi:hypothetical protein